MPSRIHENGMAESSAAPSGRDYESRMDLSNTPTVLAQLAAAFEHFNEVHPHSSLKMRSLREFGRQRAEQMRRAQLEQPALHCELGRVRECRGKAILNRPIPTRIQLGSTPLSCFGG